MRRKVVLMISMCLLLVLSILFTGCANKTGNADTKDLKEDRFEIVKYEGVDDGSVAKLNVMVLIDKKTRVMYLYTEKDGCRSELQVMLDPYGDPLLYKNKNK